LLGYHCFVLRQELSLGGQLLVPLLLLAVRPLGCVLCGRGSDLSQLPLMFGEESVCLGSGRRRRLLTEEGFCSPRVLGGSETLPVQLLLFARGRGRVCSCCLLLVPEELVALLLLLLPLLQL
jgi:hypothetical protein